MRYKIRIERKAIKKLKKVPQPYYNNLKTAILKLAHNPRPESCRKLKGRDAYRIRVSNYRVIYEIHDEVLLILVITVGHRSDVYRQ